MRPVLTAEAMREADRRTIEAVGLPGAVLMENAGAAVVRALLERYPEVQRPLVLCGRGNNGGDGFVVARRLLDRNPEVVLLGRREELKGDARLHQRAFEASGGQVHEVTDEEGLRGLRERPVPPLVVDAIFGTGLAERPRGVFASAIEQATAWALAGTPVVAVDLPSGLVADASAAGPPCVLARLTVTFGALKPAHVLPPASDRMGELVVADIGIPSRVIEELQPRLFLLEAEDARACYPARPAASHKGTFGHVLVIAGSQGKAGAAILAATGALRAGAGLVTVASPVGVFATLSGGRPELMTEALAEGSSGGVSEAAIARALDLAGARDAVVLGPGLGQDPGTREFVRAFVPRCPIPLVVDADGLNALSSAGAGPLELLARQAPTVVTPHPGEMARLASLETAVVQQRRLETAREFAQASGAVVVLKGQRTLVAEKSGRAVVNPTGNPGMATAGSGDVLAGVVGALLCRRDAWPAAVGAVYLHGLAGDRVVAARGETGLLAGDLAEALPEAVRALAGGSPSTSR